MTQELMAQTNALACALDKSRNIRKNKAVALAHTYNAEIRHKSCEVVIADFWLRL